MGPNTWNTHKLPTATTPLCSAFHLSRQQQCPLSLDISLTVTNKQSLQLFRSNFLAQILVLHYHMLRLLQGNISVQAVSQRQQGMSLRGIRNRPRRLLQNTETETQENQNCSWFFFFLLSDPFKCKYKKSYLKPYSYKFQDNDNLGETKMREWCSRRSNTGKYVPVKARGRWIVEVPVRVHPWQRTHTKPAEVLHAASTRHFVTTI